jgi:hypothetical protein
VNARGLRRKGFAPWWVLGLWTATTLVLVFAKDRFSRDNVTHLGILAVLGASFLSVPLIRHYASAWPRSTFIGTSVLFAVVVEGCYMITAPLHPALLVTRETGAAGALRNFAVDVLLTTPAYVVVFAVVWWLIRRYNYTTWQYALLVPAGQALGDAQAFLVANPFLLLFLPYLLINYQAMSLAAFLGVHSQLPEGRRNGPGKFLVPLVVLPLTYGVCGTIVIGVGKALRFL